MLPEHSTKQERIEGCKGKCYSTRGRDKRERARKKLELCNKVGQRQE